MLNLQRLLSVSQGFTVTNITAVIQQNDNIPLSSGLSHLGWGYVMRCFSVLNTFAMVSLCSTEFINYEAPIDDDVDYSKCDWSRCALYEVSKCYHWDLYSASWVFWIVPFILKKCPKSSWRETVYIKMHQSLYQITSKLWLYIWEVLIFIFCILIYTSSSVDHREFDTEWKF